VTQPHLIILLPAVYKSLTCPGSFWPNPKRFFWTLSILLTTINNETTLLQPGYFFEPDRMKIENIGFFEENLFEPERVDPIRAAEILFNLTRSNILGLNPSLAAIPVCLILIYWLWGFWTTFLYLSIYLAQKFRQMPKKTNPYLKKLLLHFSLWCEKTAQQFFAKANKCGL